MINRQETACAEIEHPSGSPHLNVARQHVDSDPSLGFMLGHPRFGSQRDQDDAKIIVLDERSRILTGVPCGLGLQAMNFGLQVELHERDFDNKEDLLVSRLEVLRASLQAHQRHALAQAARTDDRMFAYSHEMFVHVDEHRAVFRSMVGKRSGAVIQQLFHKMLVDLVRDDIRALMARAASNSTPTEAVVQLVAGGLFGLVLWWVDGRMKLSIEEVNALFRRLAIPAVRAM